MQKLNLPPYDVNLRKMDGKIHIFDPIRKKYLVLTPEEWVRQHFLQFLIHHKSYPASLIKMESGLKYYERNKRTDLVVYNRAMKPHLLVECKAPDVKITDKTFSQIANYYSKFQAKYMIITNGMEHYCFRPDASKLVFEEEIPEFSDL
ncbi:type I restriction enzyme HsdR N-terminal domain-containing protein [Marivirga sp.]|uniref:type I restriction enzyme HsdR N-terminal domain-containing protein n=1 Tax=Marivirga sp. TaxID=2018662 RepID=UPI003DA78E3E